VERTIRLIHLPAAITTILAIAVIELVNHQEITRRSRIDPGLPNTGLELGARIVLEGSWSRLIIAWLRRHCRMQRWQLCECGYSRMGLEQRVGPERGRTW
jgi:hypothetical protein